MTTNEQETGIFLERDDVKEYTKLIENQTQRMFINKGLGDVYNQGRRLVISLKCGTCSEDIFTTAGPVYLLEQPNGASRPVCLSCMEKHPRGTVVYEIAIRVVEQKTRMASDDSRIEKDVEREVRREGRDDRVYPH